MQSIIETAYRWISHASTAGCRFDLESKAAEAVAFSVEKNASGFAFPSKLEGTSRHQDTVATLARCPRYEPLTLTAQESKVVALWRGSVVGRVRSKHTRWLLPLLRFGTVRCYVLQVTGGPENGHKWYGCNIVLAGIGAALEARAEAVAERVQQIKNAPQPRDEQGRFLPRRYDLALQLNGYGGDGASAGVDIVGEPVAFYAPDPDGSEEWHIEYTAEPAETTVQRVLHEDGEHIKTALWHRHAAAIQQTAELHRAEYA